MLTVTETPSLFVTTTSDIVNNTDGLTSLREALAYAAVNPGTDAIGFFIPKSDPGYDFTTNKFTITLGGTQLEINSGVQINGPGGPEAGVVIESNHARSTPASSICRSISSMDSKRDNPPIAFSIRQISSPSFARSHCSMNSRVAT
ncbi:MAG TPA: CSLREA domain-containing protein [Pyrinomonadaceae bacterium]|nr:CSLREA domain-containing protein [Pyrinomonadaceae bacterium]